MRKFSGLLAAILFLLIPVWSAYSQTYLAARLSQAQQFQSGSKTDSIDKGYTGTAIFIISPDSSSAGNMTLRFMLTVGKGNPASDTSQAVIVGRAGKADSSILKAIYFRTGAIGDSGTTVLSITSGITGNSYTATYSTSGGLGGIVSQVIDAVVAGKVFIVAKLDSGQIRGHIHPVTGAGFFAHLTAPQEADSANNSKASGVGSFLLTDLGLIYQVSVQGINIVASHIHMGMPGISGDIVKPLTFSGHTAIGIWKANDQTPLTKELLTMLLTEGLYVNVHSTQFLEGEIRGQILHASGLGFSAPLKSSKPGSLKGIIGNASFTLTDFGLVYHINLRGNTTLNNIYFADIKTNQKLFDIPKFTDTTFSGVWFSRKAYETNPLVDGKVADLIQGNILLTVEASNDTVKSVITLNKQTNFTAILTGPQERPKHMVRPTGLGHFVLTPSGLQYYITVAGIDSITGSHFHFGDVGINGPIVHPFHIDSSFTAQGIWDLKADQTSGVTMNMIDALLEGKIFVNVHTRKYPGGEIRGQLVPASGTDFTSNLTGAQVVPASTEKTVGTGNFILTNEGLTYRITVDSLKITGIQFERGHFGTAGKVVNKLTGGFDTTNTVVGLWGGASGTTPFTYQLVRDLLTDNIYVSVLTSANPMGAIRGQILLNGGMGFVAIFDSAAVTQGQTASTGKGNGMFVLTDAGLRYDISVAGYTGNEGSITTGQGGTSVFTLPQNFNGGSSNGVWLMLNDTVSARNNMASLFNNQLFINLTGGPAAPIRRTFTPAPTSVELLKAIPESFALEQNYPNPFNPTTTIRFSIPLAGAVSLHIYNVLGQKVATLIDEQLRAGLYEVSFDGSSIASGVYFYRISFQNNVVTRKMMLIK